MSDNQFKSITFFTAPFILSYPRLVAPAKFKDKNQVEKGDPLYSFEGIVDPATLKQWQQLDRDSGNVRDDVDVEKVLVALAKEVWPGIDVKTAVASKDLKWPFKSGDKLVEAKGDKVDHYKDKKYFRAKAKTLIKGNPFAPNLYVAHPDGLEAINRGHPNFDQLAGNKFYAGALCTAEVTAATGDTSGKYITFYFNSIIFEKDGERIGGSGSNIEKLRGVRGGQSSYDPTQGMDTDLDDEIPF